MVLSTFLHPSGLIYKVGGVLVCWGYDDKIPQTWWFRQQTLLSYSSGSCKSMIKVSAGLAPCEASLLLADGFPLAAALHGCISVHV